jgi:tetratricopeptide (TPR) repeat protein
MTPWLTLLSCALLTSAVLVSGCVHRPLAPAAAPQLLHDNLFTASTERTERSAIFELSDEMLAYVKAEFGHLRAQEDPRKSLLEALNKHRLKLSYDAGITRNAAQAFAAKSGNCLSLVLMTAAFAKHLNLPYSYQSVNTDALYSRSADLLLASGHVNLVLERLNHQTQFHPAKLTELIVDFLPPSELRGQVSRSIAEATIVAMYFNNRAAEQLAAGRIDEAYHWSREAVMQDGGFAAAINTLAVIYLRRQHLPQAEAALRHLLALEPDNTAALSNLVLVLQRNGRDAEAQQALLRLRELQPVPPLHDFDQGRQALNAGDLQAARGHFARELRRQPFHPDVHFWAAMTLLRLGEPGKAKDHLQLAVDNSVNNSTHDLYAAKLAALRAQQKVH